ncbi:hypothetical protein BDY21DRAFT_184939 [Lineolata rhizophorae]|uniref:Uncharacterized protein n=1 Tax=Lineolata rhizophorae TaxID=578093 RepID=A0A6A6P8C7_9PEZI|nr:hypothetical protein BDY21DRAFT_184939 [Lineolata rhizophorae]
MMQNNFTSSWAYSTAMCFSPERRLTSAFVHSLSDHETDDVINKITAHRDDIGRPGLLPSVLLAPRVHSANTKVRDCHSLIAHIEDHTGIFPNWHPNSDCCAKHRKDHKGQKRHFTIDFDQVTNDLTSVSHKLAYCEYVSEVHLPMFETILEIESRVDRFNMDAQPKDRTVEFFQPRETGEAASRLRIRNELLKGSLHDTTRRARYLSKRSQAQVQTIYSLVAQKDSLIAQKNNALSMRDSAAMKVISVITAAFLPATFTATLFSTTFFDFQPEKEGHIASAWLWLYFAVAIILTIIIFSWWYVSSRHVTKKIHKSLGRTEDGERTPLPNRWIGSLMADMYGVFTSPFRRKKAQGDAESSDSSGYDLDKHML